jgi:hypothetical protein
MISIAHQRSFLCGKTVLRNIVANRSNSGFQSHLNHFMCYSSLSKEDEEKEKQRVASLSKYQKEMELREYDKQIARLNTLRGINTGELYTMRGKFKALARDYGMAFMVYYWTVWFSTAALTYTAIEVGGIDAMAVIAKVDAFTGYDMTSKIDPTLGTIGVTLVANELLEPIRLPLVVMTTKPVVELISPKSY